MKFKLRNLYNGIQNIIVLFFLNVFSSEIYDSLNGGSYKEKVQHLKHVLEFYDKEVNNMNNAFRSGSPYNFNYRLDSLLEVLSLIATSEKRKDYISIMSGVSAKTAIEKKQKEHTVFAVKTISLTNPLFDLFNLDSDGENIVFDIDTIIDPNEFISIIMQIYQSLVDFSIEYTIEKSNSRNRLCFKIKIIADTCHPYEALEEFIDLINNKILDHLSAHEMNEDYKKATYFYFDRFYSLLKPIVDTKFVDKIVFNEEKGYISSILNKNTVFTKKLVDTFKGE